MTCYDLLEVKAYHDCHVSHGRAIASLRTTHCSEHDLPVCLHLFGCKPAGTKLRTLKFPINDVNTLVHVDKCYYMFIQVNTMCFGLTSMVSLITLCVDDQHIELAALLPHQYKANTSFCCCPKGLQADPTSPHRRQDDLSITSQLLRRKPRNKDW